MYVIFFGPPGVGKGTQAAIIAGRMSWVHISTGDMLRAHVSEGTELGRKAKAYMDQGLLTPDDLVIDMFMARLTEIGDQGFVLDGFPRTLPQARALDAALMRGGRAIDVAINITAPEDVLMARMEGRAAEGGGRSDDTPEAMRKRLEVQKPPEELLAHYRDAGKLRDVDGTPAVEAVTDAIAAALAAVGPD